MTLMVLRGESFSHASGVSAWARRSRQMSTSGWRSRRSAASSAVKYSARPASVCGASSTRGRSRRRRSSSRKTRMVRPLKSRKGWTVRKRPSGNAANENRNRGGLPRRDGHPSAPCRDSVRQPDGAAAFVSVYREKEDGVGWRMIDRFVEDQKIRPKLGDRERLAADLDVHFHFGRVADMTV